jgi:S-adenosylmethionine hydrolase
MRKVITFLSDFGTKDSYVAQVKGRILSMIPDVLIVDITHECDPYYIISAAWLLHTTWKEFPLNTVHLAVVDPGVGTGRAVLALEKAGHFFVGPDNGIFSFIYPAKRAFEITWRPKAAVSSTFHARDIMAEAAAMILGRIQPAALGIPIENPVVFDVSSPMVVGIDRFGNVVTNIGAEGGLPEEITINGKKISKPASTFADIEEGGLAMIRGSAGTLEIVSNMANAAEMLKARVGMKIDAII